MRFQFSITHVPGKALTTVDALSRALLTQTISADEQLTMDSDFYVSAVLQNLPVTDKRLAEIQKAQEQDAVCKAVKQTCKQGWPNCSNLKGVLKKYTLEADHLSNQDEILLYNDKLVIPTVRQQQILTKLHTGTQRYISVNKKHMSQYGS